VVLQKFLPGHAKIGRDADNIFFREDRAVLPATIPASAAIVSGKQLSMKRQKLPIQLVRIRMDLRACLKSFDDREGKADNRGKTNQQGMRKRCINIQAISAGKNMR